MNNKQAEDLLLKYQAGTLNVQERAMIEDWYAKFPDRLKKFSEADMTADRKESWELLAKQYSPKKVTLWPRIAAAAMVLLMVSIGLYEYMGTKSGGKVKQTVQDIAPGRNLATLTLSNGKKILLTDAALGTLAQEDGVKISKTADGKILYEIASQARNDASEGNAFNTISTPVGGQYQIILPDRTIVYLNAASSLTYPVAFSNVERKVQLKGEAYFEVAKAYKGSLGSVERNNGFSATRTTQRLPFLVVSRNQMVEVLGTHFNVNSYDDEKDVKTTLLEGSVRVISLPGQRVKQPASILLKPNQQAILSSGEQIDLIEVDAEEVASWKNGKFTFSSEPLGSIMKKAERWYNVNVVFEDNTIGLKLTGSISRFDNISSLLKTLEATGEVSFTVKDRTILVSKAKHH